MFSICITTNEKYSCWALLCARTFWTCSKKSYWPAEATRTRRTLFELIVIVIVIARMTRNDQEWSPEQTRIVNSSSFGSRFGTVGLVQYQQNHYYLFGKNNAIFNSMSWYGQDPGFTFNHNSVNIWNKVLNYLIFLQSGIQIMKKLVWILMKFGTEFSITHLKFVEKQKLFSFQYKLMHRVIACNAWLKNITTKNTPTWQYCNEDDNIQHFVLFCSKTHDFWDILVIGGNTSLTYFLQTFLIISKNVYSLDSLVIVMIC